MPAFAEPKIPGPSADDEIPEDTSRPDPDPVDTAREAPKAEDLERYTKGIDGQGELIATIWTSKGNFHCVLFEERTPVTVANLVGLARGLKAYVDPKTREAKSGQPFYEDTIIHRVIPNFMIQLGDRAGTGMGTPGYRFANEIRPGLRHDGPGILSMANTGRPVSNGSQFFITEAPTPHLDGKHTVFGQCDNFDLVREITRVPRDVRDRPKEDVKVRAITFHRAEGEDVETASDAK
jgi:cyclophilin family peptidyl-prolyl cis-trans isomerase